MRAERLLSKSPEGDMVPSDRAVQRVALYIYA